MVLITVESSRAFRYSNNFFFASATITPPRGRRVGGERRGGLFSFFEKY